MTDNSFWRWIDDTFLDLGRQFRWSYLPPLMIYLAAGVQDLTAIVGTFFIEVLWTVNLIKCCLNPIKSVGTISAA